MVRSSREGKVEERMKAMAMKKERETGDLILPLEMKPRGVPPIKDVSSPAFTNLHSRTSGWHHMVEESLEGGRVNLRAPSGQIRDWLKA